MFLCISYCQGNHQKDNLVQKSMGYFLDCTYMEGKENRSDTPKFPSLTKKYFELKAVKKVQLQEKLSLPSSFSALSQNMNPGDQWLLLMTLNRANRHERNPQTQLRLIHSLTLCILPSRFAALRSLRLLLLPCYCFTNLLCFAEDAVWTGAQALAS